MIALRQDLSFALRQLRKNPGFTVTAVLTLALGIGVNTAIFSVVNSLLLKPLPIAKPDQFTELVERAGKGPLQQVFSWPQYRAIRDRSRGSFSDLIAAGTNLDGFAVQGRQPQRLMTAFVSGNYFEGLGLKPAAGRLFVPSEGEVIGRDPVVVLDYRVWQQIFHGDPGVAGRHVTVDGQPFTVVGVAPKGFHGTTAFVTAQAYLPISEMPVLGTPADQLNRWQNGMFLVYGRLHPGIGIPAAEAALKGIAAGLMREHPEGDKNLSLALYPEPSLRVETGDPNIMYVIAGLFLGLAGLVLLLAAVNVANLVLVRATVREREMAIRTALGAQRSRLVAQMITESVTLALIGGGFGVVLGQWASSLLGHLNAHADIPITLAFDFDWRIFLYSLTAALLAGVVLGILPALRMAKSNVNAVLREGGRGLSGGRHWFRDVLVVLQVGSSLVLLVVTGLFVRSLSAMENADLGFNPAHVLNITVDPNEIGYRDAPTRDLARNILERLHGLAGVQAVSHAGSVPLGYFGNGGDTLVIDGAPTPANPSSVTASYNVVSPEYFDVMGISLLHGRGFTGADDEHNRDVAIVSAAMAKKYWPSLDPIGRTFTRQSEKVRKLTVVGVAGDAEFHLWGGAKEEPYFYIPYAQHYAGNSMMTFQLRTAGDPMLLAPEAQAAIRGLAPQLPLFMVQSMHQALYTLNGLMLFQLAAALAAVMGGLGLTLAVVGLYGVVSYAVSQRTHEIGLRMALGAGRGDVLRMIYRQAGFIVGGGLVLGLALALGAARAVAGFVVVSAYDPSTYLVVASALALVALVSCYLPARRATHVEPMIALRRE